MIKRISLSIAVLLAAPVFAQQPRAPQKPAGPWMDKTLSPDQRADMVVEQMTLDEKIQLVHGTGWNGEHATDVQTELLHLRSNGGAGYVPGIPRLGLPGIQMADSAVGVARGGDRSRYATALPSALAAASTWDPKMAYEYGALIGRELRDQGYNMTLGGGVDITREPRNGRNFEYLGEDPILAGTLVGQWIKGLQAQGVIGDIKHYALNDQETGRNIVNVILDKRSMRETDLLAFEIGVKDGDPGGVMCSYNLVNGDWACENDYLLNEVLKKDWGFKGFVVSDWGGTHTTTKAALAGLDQEEPGGRFFGDALKKAVESGEVPMARLNDMVHRVVRTEFACGIVDNPPDPKVVDIFGGMKISQHVAESGTVLLKNANRQLPLNAALLHSIAVIGSHSDVAVLSGSGSAQVDPPGGNAVPGKKAWDAVTWDPSSPLEAIRAMAPHAKVEYNAGTDPAAAAALAKSSDIAIVFVNQPMSEGRDAPTLSLPDNQDALVRAVAAANPKTIVVLETGGPVSMPWIGNVSAAVEAWYPGIRGADAITNILFGRVNPSAKLAVTFAKSDADLPHPQVPGLPKHVGKFDANYTEGLKVGYKWFDAEDKQPLFPFGFGLSYTTFSYSALKASSDSVTFTVRNTGRRAGTEIAEVYAALPKSTGEPPRRLVGWDRVDLAPGEAKTVKVALDPFRLSIFNVDKDGWELVPGEYKITVGGSSQSTPLQATVSIPGQTASR